MIMNILSKKHLTISFDNHTMHFRQYLQSSLNKKDVCSDFFHICSTWEKTILYDRGRSKIFGKEGVDTKVVVEARTSETKTETKTETWVGETKTETKAI